MEHNIQNSEKDDLDDQLEMTQDTTETASHAIAGKLSTVSFLFGLISIAISFINYLTFISPCLGIVGLISGFFARDESRVRDFKAKVGMTMSAISITISIIVVIFYIIFLFSGIEFKFHSFIQI